MTMEKLLYLINHKKQINILVYYLIKCLLFIVRVEKIVVIQTEKLRESNYEVEYWLGFALWFAKLKLNVSLPAYNIYQLIDASDVEKFNRILEPKTKNRKVKKQYVLLNYSSDENEKYLNEISLLLESILKNVGKNTSFKQTNFDSINGLNSLEQITQLLKQNGITTFLVSGTLLGMIRDGGLIEGDNDIDIGVWADETDIGKIKKLLVHDPRYLYAYEMQHMIKVKDRNGIIIDIFLHYKDGEFIWHGTDIHRWYNKQFQLKRFCVGNNEYLIPDNEERYLDENYGDWKNPVLFWDYSFDTPNQNFPRNSRTAFYLLERIERELNKSTPSRYHVETALKALKDTFGIDYTRVLGSGGRYKSVEINN